MGRHKSVHICPNCGCSMSYSEIAKRWECPSCNAYITKEEDGSGLSYEEIYSDPSRIESAPEGCRACGGPYPICKQGCPMFDDE